MSVLYCMTISGLSSSMRHIKVIAFLRMVDKDVQSKCGGCVCIAGGGGGL